MQGLEQLSGYSDSLRAGRTGDRTPVEAIFSTPIQTDPAAPQSPIQCERVSPGGKAAGAWRRPPTPCSAEVK